MPANITLNFVLSPLLFLHHGGKFSVVAMNVDYDNNAVWALKVTSLRGYF